jgi:hypothetical protein
MLSYHTLLLFRYDNRDLDKPTLAYFRPVTPLCPDTAVPCFKDTHRNPSKLSHDALFLRCEAKPRVGSDWFLSSSKLQPYLELCRFVQTLLKTKVARWKAHLLLSVCKKTHVQHSSEQMAYYLRYAIGKKGVALGVS